MGPLFQYLQTVQHFGTARRPKCCTFDKFWTLRAHSTALWHCQTSKVLYIRQILDPTRTQYSTLALPDVQSAVHSADSGPHAHTVQHFGTARRPNVVQGPLMTIIARKSCVLLSSGQKKRRRRRRRSEDEEKNKQKKEEEKEKGIIIIIRRRRRKTT